MTNTRPSNNIAKTLTSAAASLRSNDNETVLVGLAAAQKEISVSPEGVVYAETGKFTGRSAKDKYIVRDGLSADTVWWENSNSMTPAQFDVLQDDMLAYAAGKDLHTQSLYAGADKSRRFDVEVFSESPWHCLFIRHLLIRPSVEDLKGFDANVTIVHMPGFNADPAKHGTRSETCIALDFTRNIVLICGTFYAGEIKKSVFSLFNFHAPDMDVFPMHCSANVGEDGDTTLFFGLSGTGKTTLSTAADRALIGDDEHGWSKEGVFNLEGGCYAKAIKLTEATEPEIYNASRQYGSVLENVIFDPKTFAPDFDDDSATENTRIAYPIEAIPNRVESGVGPSPRNVVLLAADAFGVLPPVAKLTRDQAIFYFLSGYTAKLAGTERGVTTPEATFSACFGAPFMSRHPSEYGQMLADRLDETGANCWLLNTGWTGGAYGVGHRMSLKMTRRILDAALSGELDDAAFRTDPIFGLLVPAAIKGVDADVLDPRAAWADAGEYDAQAKKLVAMFEANLEQLGGEATKLAGSGTFKTVAA